MITDEQLEEYNNEYLDRLVLRIKKILCRRVGKIFIVGDLEIKT